MKIGNNSRIAAYHTHVETPGNFHLIVFILRFLKNQPVQLLVLLILPVLFSRIFPALSLALLQVLAFPLAGQLSALQ